MFWFWRRWGHRVRRCYRAALWQRDDFQRDVSGGNRSKRTLLETAFQQLLDLFQESERFPASLWGQNQETQNIFSSPGPSVCRNVVPTFILVMGYNFWKVLTNWFMFELKEFGATNRKKLLVARLQETEIRFYWSFTSSSPHLFLRDVQTADRPPSPPIFLLPAAPSSTSVSWYSHRLSSSHLHLTSFTLSYMSLELRLVNCRESLNL